MGMNRTERWERLDQQLRDLWPLGLAMLDLSIRLGVSPSAVYRRAVALGLHERKKQSDGRQRKLITPEEQREIMEAAKRGTETAREIALRLGVSAKVVASHVSQARKKLGLKKKPGCAKPLERPPPNPAFANVPQLPDRLAEMPSHLMTEEDEERASRYIRRARRALRERHLAAMRGEANPAD